ncbi:unnamed protein product, partial [Brassica oleracea]
ENGRRLGADQVKAVNEQANPEVNLLQRQSQQHPRSQRPPRGAL